MSAEWGRVVLVDGERCGLCCKGLVGAVFSSEVVGEGQAGVCVQCDVMGASAVALVGSSAPWGRSGWVLLVNHFVDVCVSTIKSVL